MGNKLHLAHETGEILIFFYLWKKKNVGNYLQREKHSIPCKVKSGGSVYCISINMGVKLLLKYNMSYWKKHLSCGR